MQLVGLVVLVALLSGGSVGVLAVDRARQALREDILRSSLVTADLAASLAAGYMSAAEGQAREFAESAEVEHAADQGNLALATPALEHWLVQHPNLVGVGLSDPDGILRATGRTDKSSVDVLSSIERDWFSAALASGQPFRGAPALSAATRRPALPYGIPVHDGTGSIRGVMVVTVSLEALSNMLAQPRVGPNARTILIDIEHNTILAHPVLDRLLQPSSTRSEAAIHLAAGERGAIETVDRAGRDTLSAYTPVPGLPWGVLVQQFRDEAFAPLDEMMRQVIAVIVVALVIAAGIGASLAFGILRPIRRLRDVLEHMAGGELGQRVRTTRRDELGELGRGFDHMADQLQQTLAELQESETRYRRLVELSPHAFLVHDGATVLYANPAAARLVGEAESAGLLGTSVWDLIHPRDSDAVRLQLSDSPALREATVVEARLVRRNGQVFDAEISAIPTSYAGRPAYQTIVTDITPRKTAEQQAKTLAQAEKLRALGQMASGIAHDLNQSLMLVAGYSDLARRGLDEQPPNLEELRNLFTTATQAALDGGEAVKRLLVFTNQSAGRDRQLVDLASLVHEVAQLTAPRWRDTPQAEGHPISLSVETQPGVTTVMGSVARLREALTNLVFNAVDALPTGGTIRLAVASDGEQAVIEISDSGSGISPEVQERVFEPFFTTKGESGTGLGLAMVFGIIEQHGGRIELRSALGQGTAFRITLPRVFAAPPQVAATAPASRGPLRQLRILAVDDEPMMTKAVVRMLRPSGHGISVAGSAEEALERLSTETFDVVISDVGMGTGLNGWELAAIVKRDWPSVRFMLATGWGAAIDPIEARDKGVETVLAKPYRLSDLEDALRLSDRAA